MTFYIGHPVSGHVPELALREFVMELLVIGIGLLDVLGRTVLLERYTIEIVNLIHAFRMELHEAIQGGKAVRDPSRGKLTTGCPDDSFRGIRKAGDKGSGRLDLSCG